MPRTWLIARVQFADLPKYCLGPTAMWRGHLFDPACHAHGIEHRLTKLRLQVERMNRTIKEATVKRHNDHHDQLRTYLEIFVDAYNFSCRLYRSYDPART